MKNTRKLESNPALTVNSDFPKLHARAKTEVMSELRQRFQDPELRLKYMVDQIVLKEIKETERDFLLALPHLGVDAAEKFAACMVELRLLATDPTINSNLLKKNIITSMQKGDNLELLHIKSLRYTYPQNSGLKILEDTKENVSVGINNEKRKYPSEEVVFSRLGQIRKLLEYYGVGTRLTVIAADRDLDYLFPPDNTLVNKDTMKDAKTSSGNYLKFLRTTYPQVEEIESLSEFLTKSGSSEAYLSICKRCA